jgi:hypothetical protein
LRDIVAEAKTVRQLLSGTKYGLDYYQRDYKWQTKHVDELLRDLSKQFLDDYEEAHERNAVEGYGHYFLGSIITSPRNGKNFVIDGQQRLTTLTLLLIYLHNLQRNRNDAVPIEELIFSEKYSRRSFNIDVDERSPVMNALFNEQPVDIAEQPEAVRNIVARYQDIEELFPGDLTEVALPYFIDWLIENVHFVEISASTDEDAYTIFETMNDRGLSLSPTDMLKGYLLANIKDESDRIRANNIWKERLGILADLGKDEDADSIKSWLRSQAAETIRDRKRGATPRDFDRIGTEFHRWVKDSTDELGLIRSTDFMRFIERDFAFYARQYTRIRAASATLTPGLESIFYNAQHSFTLQYPVLLAPLSPDDSEGVINAKLQVAGAYIDILIARRLWNFRIIAYSTMQYAMFLVMREIRGKEPAEAATLLRARLDAEPETFSSNDRLRLHQQNRYSIHQLLARLTDHVETRSGQASRYLDYVSTVPGPSRYEVEHIWADKPERHLDEFAHPADFAEYRNRVGGLLVLPKSFNGSYGPLPYEEKLRHYDSQNLLARSLSPNAYERNPGFLQYIERSHLPFHAHPQFKRADLDERQELYRLIAEEVWSADRLTPAS